MELNSLNIPETNRRDLQRLLDQAYAGYVADLDALADEAADAIEAQYRSNPLFMRDVVEDYSRQSAQLADDYFSQLRAIWAEQSGVDLPEFEHPDLLDPSEVLYRMNGGFSGTDWNGLNYSDLVAGRSNAGLSVDSLWPELKTIDDWQQLIGDMVSTSARLMTMRDMHADPTKPNGRRVHEAAIHARSASCSPPVASNTSVKRRPTSAPPSTMATVTVMSSAAGEGRSSKASTPTA